MALPRILVVDDDRDTRELYRLLFETAGYSVDDAASVEQAAEVAAAVFPALVVADWTFGDGNGFELCERLRQDPRTGGIPILAVTGRSLSRAEVERCKRLGCIDVLTKPVELETLTALVGSALGVP